MSGLVYILDDGKVYVPPYDISLVSVTTRRLLELIKKKLLGKEVSAIEGGKLSIVELKKRAKEMFLMSVDTVTPILKWDDVEISKEAGKVTKLVIELLSEDVKSAEATIDIDSVK